MSVLISNKTLKTTNKKKYFFEKRMLRKVADKY